MIQVADMLRRRAQGTLLEPMYKTLAAVVLRALEISFQNSNVLMICNRLKRSIDELKRDAPAKVASAAERQRSAADVAAELLGSMHHAEADPVVLKHALRRFAEHCVSVHNLVGTKMLVFRQLQKSSFALSSTEIRLPQFKHRHHRIGRRQKRHTHGPEDVRRSIELMDDESVSSMMTDEEGGDGSSHGSSRRSSRGSQNSASDRGLRRSVDSDCCSYSEGEGAEEDSLASSAGRRGRGHRPVRPSPLSGPVRTPEKGPEKGERVKQLAGDRKGGSGRSIDERSPSQRREASQLAAAAAADERAAAAEGGGGRSEQVNIAAIVSPRQNRRSWIERSASAGNFDEMQPDLLKLRLPAKKPRIQDFRILKPISKGAFGRVYLCSKKTTQDIFAVKVVPKEEAGDAVKNKADVKEEAGGGVRHARAEREVLAQMGTCPHIAKLIYCFQSTHNLFIVLEYLPGGDLYSLLQNLCALSEAVVMQYVEEKFKSESEWGGGLGGRMQLR
jgi:serine/threonine-protein kinase RIM15